MRTLFLFVIGVFFTFCNTNAQENLNVYKYVSIPKRFDFQKTADAHQINSLTKFLFEKKGFETFFSDENLPDEIFLNPCLKLNVNLVDESNLFTTKVYFELFNCMNQLVLKTEIGSSREKDLKKGFHEAIRTAFTTIENTPYQFSDDKRVVDILVLPEAKPTTAPEQVKKEVVVVEELVVPEKKEINLLTEKKYQDKVPVIAEIPKIKNAVTVEGVFQSDTNMLSIKKQGNQFVVSDAQQNVVAILYPTSQANYFIIKWLQSDDNQPKLAFLNSEGDLLIDIKDLAVVYKRKSL
jgi:hypothetical protein